MMSCARSLSVLAGVLAISLAAGPAFAAERVRAHAEGERALLAKPEVGGSKTANPSHVVHEGDVAQPLWIDTSRVVEFPAAGSSGRPAIRQAEPGEVVESNRTSKPDAKGAASSADAGATTGSTGSGTAAAAAPAAVSPVFVDASGQPRALPGGVIVSLKEDLSEDRARATLEGEGLVPVRRIGARMWMVDSPVGIASLELANRLHDSGRFEFVQPNWWKPRTTK